MLSYCSNDSSVNIYRYVWWKPYIVWNCCWYSKLLLMVGLELPLGIIYCVNIIFKYIWVAFDILQTTNMKKMIGCNICNITLFRYNVRLSNVISRWINMECFNHLLIGFTQTMQEPLFVIQQFCIAVQQNKSLQLEWSNFLFWHLRVCLLVWCVSLIY